MNHSTLTCNIEVTHVTDSDWRIQLFSRDGDTLLTAVSTEESTTGATVMLASTKPELSVAAHAGAGGVVRNPERGSLRVALVHSLPAHLEEMRM